MDFWSMVAVVEENMKSSFQIYRGAARANEEKPSPLNPKCWPCTSMTTYLQSAIRRQFGDRRLAL